MNVKLIILGLVIILAISIGMYFLFKDRKSKDKCKNYKYSSIKSALTGRCLNSEPLDQKLIPQSYKGKVPPGTNAINRQQCNNGDEQKWIIDGDKIKNLKTGQYLYSDDSYPGWTALGDINNKEYNDVDFSWNINNINSVNNLKGFSIANNKIGKSLQDNPNWTHLIMNPQPVPPASPFDEEVWNFSESKQVCQ